MREYLSVTVGSDEVKPNPLFSSGAVLQQGVELPVWGTAAEGETVTVTFQDQKVQATAKDGRWMVRLRPLKPGGPFTMTIAGRNAVELNNILVGEVWICSGQSNMQWRVNESANAEEVVKSSGDPMLRLLTVPPKEADTPEQEAEVSWHECGIQTMPDFSAVGYFFGRDLRKALNVPVGLINTSYGGTPAESWMSRRAHIEEPEFREILKYERSGPQRPTVLYNAMIAPLIPYAIRGAIWYQGESNADRADQYKRLFPAMIRNWREDWGQGDFPFLFVQLAPFTAIREEPGESAWAEIREAQSMTARDVPNTAMAVITDCGDQEDIHPNRKEPVGARLALAARAIVYGEHISHSGPIYKSMRVKGDRIALSFAHVGKGLEARGGELKGFAIAGEDRKFVNAQAQIVGKTVVVWSAKAPRPVAVRYGWAYFPVVNLYNKDGLPASPFRTDNFHG